MAEKYEQDVFYDTKNLSLETKKQILIEAKELCYEWKVDILDASKSWTRQKTEMSFDKILDKLTSECHYSIITN